MCVRDQESGGVLRKRLVAVATGAVLAGWVTAASAQEPVVGEAVPEPTGATEAKPGEVSRGTREWEPEVDALAIATQATRAELVLDRCSRLSSAAEVWDKTAPKKTEASDARQPKSEKSDGEKDSVDSLLDVAKGDCGKLKEELEAYDKLAPGGAGSDLAAKLKAATAAARASVQKTEAAIAKEKAAAAKAPSRAGQALVKELLAARCKTAICFDRRGAGARRENWFGIEPLVELPVGKSFALGSGGLADYVNNHSLRIDFTAGLRVWVHQDWVSGSVYLSQPLIDRPVRVPGSSFEYPASALRRPYPGVALGVFFDTLWLALDRDELRNPDSVGTAQADPGFPPNGLVDSCWTLTIALQPLTAFRTAIGRAVEKREAAGE